MSTNVLLSSTAKFKYPEVTNLPVRNTLPDKHMPYLVSAMAHASE